MIPQYKMIYVLWCTDKVTPRIVDSVGRQRIFHGSNVVSLDIISYLICIVWIIVWTLIQIWFRIVTYYLQIECSDQVYQKSLNPGLQDNPIHPDHNQVWRTLQLQWGRCRSNGQHGLQHYQVEKSYEYSFRYDDIVCVSTPSVGAILWESSSYAQWWICTKRKMVDLREKQARSALGWSWAHQGEIQYDIHGSGAFMILGFILVFIFLLLYIFNLCSMFRLRRLWG